MSAHRPRKRDKGRKLNGPPQKEPWCWLTKAMFVSPAWQELIRHRGALLVVLRVVLEHMEHAGENNGRLIVTYEDFVDYCGIGERHIPENIDIAEALGFLIVHRGRKSKKDRRHPNRYGLTFYHLYEEFGANDWNRIKTTAQAQAIVERVKARRAAEAAKRKAEREAAPSLVPDADEGGGQDAGTAEAVRTGTSGD